MPRYIELDVHQRYVHACEFRPDRPERQQERHFRFPNTPEAWTTLVAELDREAVVVLKVTGNAFEIHDILSPHAGEVLLANPAELRRLGSGRHTDPADAARLAKMAALGIVPAVWVPPPPLRQVRRLLKTRERLESQRRALLNQARAALGRHGIRVPRGADPAVLLERVEGVPLPPGERLAVQVTLEAAQVLEAQVEVLTAEIARQVAEVPEVRLLLTVTGVGLLTAATVWAKLGDPGRFRGPKQVARYAGLDPSVDQSGERDRRGRISRHGDRLLRRALIEAAWSVARHDEGELGRFFRRKAAQIGTRKAIVALARKLLIVAWQILRTGEPYRAQKPRAVQRKLWTLRRWTQRGADKEAVGQRVLQATLARLGMGSGSVATAAARRGHVPSTGVKTGSSSGRWIIIPLPRQVPGVERFHPLRRVVGAWPSTRS